MSANAVKGFVFDEGFVKSLQTWKSYLVFADGYEPNIEGAEARVSDSRMDYVSFVGGSFYVAFFL